MEKESVTDDITGLAYDSVHTVAESLKHVSSHFDFNISDFDPLDTSNLTSRRIAEAIRDSIRNVSFGGCSVRYH
jgi:hypothetical protein